MTRRRLLGVFALVVVAWLGFCVVLLLGARRDAAAGIDAVNAAKRLTSPDDLLRGAPVRPLAAARASFRSTHSKLSHPVLAPLKLVPVAGRQLRAADAMANAATVVAAVGADSVADAKAALESTDDRLALLRRMHEIAARAEARLKPVHLGPSKALVGAVADKRAEVAEQLDRIRSAASDAAVATKGLADMLAGPRTYLVFAANNAEMRAGSGMFLSVGELVMQDGKLSLGDMQPTGLLTVPPDKAPPIEDADLEKHWGWLTPNEEWRNLALSPRFAASAQLAARMWSVSHAKPVDGVLALDPVALREMLKATGPVDEVNADNVVRLLLHDQYDAFVRGETRAVQEARRDALGSIARRIFDRVSAGSIDNAALGSGLADAAKGRHVLAWSSRPDEQRAWEAAGVDGALSADSLGVALLNRAGNKLDQFMDVDVAAVLGEQAELKITIRNETPPGENEYVAGPFTGSGVAGGDYGGILSVTLPAFAYNVSVAGFEVFTASGRDGPAQVIAVPVTVKRGESASFTVRFGLPADGSVRVEPSARVPASKWTAGSRTFHDSRSTRLSWR